MFEQFVGIDIAAATFTAAWHAAQQWHTPTFEQRASDYARLVRQLSQTGTPATTLVVMEATGPYWLALAWHLSQAGFGVSVINPAQAHLFARLQLQRAKTDVLDAQLLAEFARQRQPARWSPPPAMCEQRQQRLARRDDLLGIKAQESNRLQALRHHPHVEPALLAGLERHLAFLGAELEQLEHELVALLAGEHAWAEPARRLQTIPGIGPIAAAWLLVATHAFARCETPEQAAAFAGLVPYPQLSGTSRRGHRPVGRGGHAALRKTLYMASLSAVRRNPAVKPLYDRLLLVGKPKKVARVAAARKLIHLAWAVVVKDRDFDPAFATRLHSLQSVT